MKKDIMKNPMPNDLGGKKNIVDNLLHFNKIKDYKNVKS